MRDLDEPVLPSPSPGRLRRIKFLGIGLLALFLICMVAFAPDLFPPPGSKVPLGEMVGHWLLIVGLGTAVMGFVILPRTLFDRDSDLLPDDVVIARERRKLKIAKIAGPLTGLLAVLVTSFLSHSFPGTPALAVYSPAIFISLLFVAVIWLAPSRRAYQPRIQRQRLEEFRVYDLLMLAWQIFWAGLTCFAMLPSLQALHLPPRAALPMEFILVSLIFFLLVGATIVIYGAGWMRPPLNPARDDEWARQLRARAARIGYLTLMIGIAAIYLAEVYVPAFAPLVVRWVLFLGIAIPASAYLVLDWRAGG